MRVDMKQILLWMLTPILILSGLTTLTSCSNDDNGIVEPTGQVLQDGEWMGTGEGRSGSIVVKVVVKDHQVEQVTVVSQSESVFAQEAINDIVAEAVGRTDVMSVEVDGISGATLTSTGVIDAINAALQAAMGNASDAEKTYKDGMCDIVVVGAGGAGLSAAVAAAETDGGLKIVVLEKQGILGGNTNYSTGGINAAETDIQKGLGIEDTKQLFYDDTMRGGKYENIPSLVRNLVDNAPVTISWLTGLGADLTDVGLMGGSSVKRTHRPEGGSAIGHRPALDEGAQDGLPEGQCRDKDIKQGDGTVDGCRWSCDWCLCTECQRQQLSTHGSGGYHRHGRFRGQSRYGGEVAAFAQWPTSWSMVAWQVWQRVRG